MDFNLDVEALDRALTPQFYGLVPDESGAHAPIVVQWRWLHCIVYRPIALSRCMHAAGASRPSRLPVLSSCASSGSSSRASVCPTPICEYSLFVAMPQKAAVFGCFLLCLFVCCCVCCMACAACSMSALCAAASITFSSFWYLKLAAAAWSRMSACKRACAAAAVARSSDTCIAARLCRAEAVSCHATMPSAGELARSDAAGKISGGVVGVSLTSNVGGRANGSAAGTVGDGGGVASAGGRGDILSKNCQ